MEALGFSLRQEAGLETLTLDVLKTSNPERMKRGDHNPEGVRRSASKLIKQSVCSPFAAH